MDLGGLKIYGSATLVKGLPRYVSEPVLRKKKQKCKISSLNGMTKAVHFEADMDPKHCIKYRPILDCPMNSFTFLHHLYCFEPVLCASALRSGSVIWNAEGFFFNGEHKLCFDFYIFSLNSTVAFKKAVLRIRIRDPVLFRLRDPDPG
jgi:hypothetical protein